MPANMWRSGISKDDIENRKKVGRRMKKKEQSIRWLHYRFMDLTGATTGKFFSAGYVFSRINSSRKTENTIHIQGVLFPLK